MKKKLFVMTGVLFVMGVLAGCGRKNEEQTVTEQDVVQCVTLGEYKGLEIAMDPIQVDQQEWDELVDGTYGEALFYATGILVEDGITDRAVEEGDVVNIDYEGKKDDVAFQGGTAQGAYLDIGSGTFIEGFEEGLVGVMPGDTVDLPLSFPERYDNADLAGQEVVFTVTVNYIMPEGFHDAIVSALGIEGVSTGEELRQFVYDYLYSVEEQNYNSILRNSVMLAFLESCEFKEIPEQILQEYKDNFQENIETGAAAIGVDADTYLMYYLGYSGGLEAFLDEYAPEAVKQDAAVQAVADAEGLKVDDDELNAALLEAAQAAGYSTVEEFVQGGSIENYRDNMVYNKVLDFLMENAVVTN